MLVRAQSKGRGVCGLLLKAEDVRRHFPRSTTAIEFKLGELRIGCELAQDFWNGRPEISDHRLCEWLEFKVFRGRPCRNPLALEMRKAGDNCFTLELPTGCDESELSWDMDRVAGCAAFIPQVMESNYRPRKPHDAVPSHAAVASFAD
ncbi:MAG: hypothetical protein WBE76_07885 [Terracidiphilus sp.]